MDIRQYTQDIRSHSEAVGVGVRMDSAPKKVFVSYVEEDGGVAHEIAKQLEAHGYSSWYYERDCPAGADYFEETFKAISDCEAMAIIISPRSLPSDQITREIVRAVEANKATLPLLLDLTHDEYAHRRPGWKQAMAAANATRVRADQIATIIPALVAGLHAKGIRSHGANGAPEAHLAEVASAPDVAAVSHEVVPAEPPRAVVVQPSVSTVAVPARAAQVVSRPAAAASNPPWIPIAAGAGVVIAAFLAWHFLKPHPKPDPVPVAPATATIVLKYNVDRHLCTPNLNMTVAGKTFHLATNPYAANDVPKGPQQYSIDGLVSCPGRKPSSATGSGVLDVREGVVYDMNWQSRPGGAGIMQVVDASTEPPPKPEENVRVNKPAAPASQVPVSSGNPGQTMFANAQTAYSQARYFEPANDSALHWAILAEKAGNPAGKVMEQQLGNQFRVQLNQFSQQQNFPAALHLVNAMLVYYPSSPELAGDQQRLMAAQNGAPLVPGLRVGPGYPPQPGPGYQYNAQAQAQAQAQARAAAVAAAQQRAAQQRPH
jgi:hypothetical protein